MSNKLVKTILFSNIDKLFLYVTNCKKTLTQTYNEIKAQYPNQKVNILNGGMWNPDGSACEGLKVSGKLLSNTPWGNVYGFGWDTVDNLCMTVDWQKYQNYISCADILKDGEKIELRYGSAQGGSRGRTAFGITKDSIIMYCTQDGSSYRATPKQLQEQLYELDTKSAIMLDCGGSSMCNFDGETVRGDGRKVHNWIVVIEKEEQKIDTENNIIENFITQNPCYTKQTKVDKTKMMLHSTGTPGGTAKSIRNNMNSASAEISVEFVIDDTGIYQLLPLGVKSWHCGSTANNTHIACEICEPIQTRLLDTNWEPLYQNNEKNTTWAVTQLQKELQAWGYDPNGIDGNFGPGCASAVKKFQQDNGLSVDGSVGPATKAKLATRTGSYLKYDPNNTEVKAYFDNVYAKAVYLFATILKQIGGKANEIVCHAEGYKQGIASNHADVNHWFPEHGKTMDVFRSDVEKAMMDNETNITNHWAQEYYDRLIARGVQLSDTRFDDNITRGEAFALADKILTALDK